MAFLKYNKIYVMAPENYSSGGVELSHQLVDYLRKKNKDASIVYIDIIKQQISNAGIITQSYQNYNIEVDISIHDLEDNVLIIPESYLFFIKKYQNIQICCWWMSVDNFYAYNASLKDDIKLSRTIFGIIRKFICYKKYKDHIGLSGVKSKDTRLCHFYQATYIQHFLYKNGFNKIFPLSDYLNTEILNYAQNDILKEDLILYNPRKGFKYTKKIIKSLPYYNFIPLIDFNREQLNCLFDRAKLYIDFGSFPGKDRLPREAAIHNCCIVTGKFGASKYFEDLPINGKYKVDINRKNGINEAVEKIDFVVKNYEIAIKDFDYFRKSIKNEQSIFYDQIANIFL